MRPFDHCLIHTCLVFAIVGSLAGCGPSPLASKMGTPLEFQEKVISKDSSINQSVRVVQLAANRTNGGLLEVKLAMENVRLGQEDFWADVQVVFLDEDRFELDRTNWQPLLIKGGQITTFSTTSLSSSAADYTVFLSNGRRSPKDK